MVRCVHQNGIAPPIVLLPSRQLLHLDCVLEFRIKNIDETFVFITKSYKKYSYYDERQTMPSRLA